MVGAKKGSFRNITEVTESDMRNILTVRIEYASLTLRIILIHAPQETDNIGDREDFFNELATQVERGANSEDVVVVMGDFNAR